MGIGSRSLGNKSVRVIESSILGTTAREVCLLLLSSLHCIGPLLLVIFIFQQVAMTRANEKFIQIARLGAYLKERLWNHNWTSNFLLSLNFDLYYEVNLATEHWKWGCTGIYFLRYMSTFASIESKRRVKPILCDWVAMSNINEFAICKAMTLRNKEI